MACHGDLLRIHCTKNDIAIPDRLNCNPSHQNKAAIPDRFNGVLVRRCLDAVWQAGAVFCLLPPHVAWIKEILQEDCQDRRQDLEAHAEADAESDAALADADAAQVADVPGAWMGSLIIGSNSFIVICCYSLLFCCNIVTPIALVKKTLVKKMSTRA